MSDSLPSHPILRLGDEVLVDSYWPLPPPARELDAEWRARVKAFRTSPSEAVLVKAVNPSASFHVLNERWVRFGALRRVG